MLNVIDTHTIKEIVSSVFILVGVIFMIISSIGILRFPDFYIRMSAITKGSTLSVGLIVTGIGIYFNEIDMLVKVIAIILFIFLTSPIAAHVIGRTAINRKIPFWGKTDIKEFLSYLEKNQTIKKTRDESDNVQ